MICFVKVFGGVFVFGRITATYVTATQAQSQVYPGVAHFQTFLAACSAWHDVLSTLKMSTAFHLSHFNYQGLSRKR